MENLKWSEEDIDRFNKDEESIDHNVFDEDSMPWRLYDASHQIKNTTRTIQGIIRSSGAGVRVPRTNSYFA